MKAGPALAAAAACWFWGCGDAEPPAPTVVSIEPNTMISSGTANVIITVDAVLPFQVDYGEGTVTVFPSLVANVGPVVVGNGRYENEGMLPAFIPSRLQPETHDVRVTLIDGRSGVLAGAFTVTPGPWPATGFTIDPIASPQMAGVHFALTIRAQGAFSATFNGTVDYFLSDVSSFPTSIAGPFTNGVWSDSIMVPSASRGPTHVTVTDLLGRIAVSNDFVVN